MNIRRLVSLAAVAGILLPLSASALEGIGPRVTVTGVVEEVRITDEQKFDEEGAEYVIRATNGQEVTVVVTKDTQIISEGRISRRHLLPVNVTKDMQIRVRGWRVGSNALTASLLIIMNISLNPVLAANGEIQAIGDNTITILATDGRTKTFSVTNETEVNIDYFIRGFDGLSLIGKRALLTLNPRDSSQVRIIRITGRVDAERTTKPSTVDLGRRVE